jgi:hypothetical protein
MRAFARTAGLAVILATLSACRSPSHGDAVNVSVLPAPMLSSSVVDQILALDEQVSGAETYHQRIGLAGQLRSGGARFVYRPGVGSGTLTFDIAGLDASGAAVARGSATMPLSPGGTVAVTVSLQPIGAPPPPPPDMCPVADDLATPTADMGGPPDLGLTDEQLCRNTCGALLACGVGEPITCTDNCLASRVFLTCVRGLVGHDCNQLALCASKQFSVTFCGGVSGYPTGTATCKETATCLGDCNIKNPTFGCACACRTDLDPAQALNDLSNTVCVGTHCASVCNPPNFNGAKCNACGLMYCGNDSCMSN